MSRTAHGVCGQEHPGEQMSTTDVAAMAITFTEDQLDPYVTHAPTRDWLTGPGLPGAGASLPLAALRTGDPRPLAGCVVGCPPRSEVRR